MSWSVLAVIETDAGNPIAAAEANREAIASYFAYRRAGGENHFPQGRIALAVTQSLHTGNAHEAASLLQQLIEDPNAGRLRPFIRALQAVVSGSRDRALADAPGLNYTMAAEILFLIETLESPSSP